MYVLQIIKIKMLTANQLFIPLAVRERKEKNKN